MLTSYATVLLGHCHQSNTLYPYCWGFLFSVCVSACTSTIGVCVCVRICVYLCKCGSACNMCVQYECDLHHNCSFLVQCSAELSVTDSLC